VIASQNGPKSGSTLYIPSEHGKRPAQ